MTQYTPWSRSDFRSVIRRELMDTGTRWVSDAELNLHLDDWLSDLQEDFEFVWATSTLTTGTLTSSLVISTATFTPTMLRMEAVYYNGYRLSGRNVQDIEVAQPEWRGATQDTPRLATMYPDAQHVLIWPTPPSSGTNTFVFEYPCEVAFATDSSTSGLPVWTQWSAKPYVCSAVYQHPGPINDPRRAARYNAQYERSKLRVRQLWHQFFPDRYRALTMGDKYEGDILMSPPAMEVV
jgi:hypothetical protein